MRKLFFKVFEKQFVKFANFVLAQREKGLISEQAYFATTDADTKNYEETL